MVMQCSKFTPVNQPKAQAPVKKFKEAKDAKPGLDPNPKWVTRSKIV